MRGPVVVEDEPELRPPSRSLAIAVAVALLSTLVIVAVAIQVGLDRTSTPPPLPTGGVNIALGTRAVAYKITPKRTLYLHLFEPAELVSETDRAAIVFFHGGGLVQTPLNQFKRQAEDLAGAGMLAVIAEYRVAWDGASFPEAADDARDTMAWVRQHSAELGLDPSKIAVAGASAGGWMAASTEALPTEQRANALILFDPALGGSLTLPSETYGGGGLPTLIVHGEKDRVTPVESSRRYCEAATHCELVVWSGGDQGFFNRDDAFQVVLERIKVFLRSIDFLGPKIN